MYIENDRSIEDLAKIAYPSYNGRKFQVETFKGPKSLNSYWDGGSRTWFVFVNLATMAIYSIEQNGTMFDGKNFTLSELPFNVALVEHSHFCGKDMGIRIYFHPDNINRYLPPVAVLTLNEQIVLASTRSFKSGYAGRKDNRFYEANHYTKITLGDWQAAIESCQAKGLLNKAKAITVNGRNAIGQKQLYGLKPSL